jgi:hypothetical protein
MLKNKKIGKKRRTTVLVVIDDETLATEVVRMNKVARRNLRAKLGDIISVHRIEDIEYLKAVHILPFDDSLEALASTETNLFDDYLRPYFQNMFRPVTKGMFLKFSKFLLHFLWCPKLIFLQSLSFFVQPQHRHAPQTPQPITLQVILSHMVNQKLNSKSWKLTLLKNHMVPSLQKPSSTAKVTQSSVWTKKNQTISGMMI